MTHPESDGITEMLEGGPRTVLTGVQRWLEMLNRRRTDQAMITQRIAARAVQHNLAHQDALHGVATALYRAAPAAVDEQAIRVGVWTSSSPDEWIRAQLIEALTQTPDEPWDIDTTVDTQADILGNWKVDRARYHLAAEQPDAAFDEQYYRTWMAMEATDAQLDEAQERAAAALERSPGRAGRSPLAFRAAVLEQLRDVVTDDARTAFYATRTQQETAAARRIQNNTATTVAADTVAEVDQDVQALKTRHEHDSHEFQVGRAEQLERQRYDRDVVESAMINDLSFGIPASEAATVATTIGTLAADREAEQHPSTDRRGQVGLNPSFS